METRSGPHPAEELRQGTKQLAIRVINMSCTIPRTKESLFIGIKWYDQQYLSVQTIGRFAVHGRKQSIPQNWVLRLKKRVEPLSGLVFWLKHKLSPSNGYNPDLGNGWTSRYLLLCSKYNTRQQITNHQSLNRYFLHRSIYRSIKVVFCTVRG